MRIRREAAPKWLMDDSADYDFGAPRSQVSVVIPVYNSAGTLLRALDSIARQSVLPCEVLLVDDCSTDGSIAVCAQAGDIFRELFPIRILHLDQNRGPSHARNRGWDLAEGNLVAFLDADDSWHREKIRVQSGFMENNPEVSLSGHLCGIHRAVMKTGVLVKATVLTPRGILLSNPFSTPTVMVRNPTPYRFSEEMRFAEDYRLWLSMALDGLVLARLECEMAVLHKHKYGDGGLSGNMWKMEKGELQMYCTLFRERRLPLLALFFLAPFSFMKFARRMALLLLKRHLTE